MKPDHTNEAGLITAADTDVVRIIESTEESKHE
jgi:hypothetical protein